MRVKGEGLAPQFTTRLEAREVLAYQEVTLECRVVGIPQPEITWYQVTTRRCSDRGCADLFHSFMRLNGNVRQVADLLRGRYEEIQYDTVGEVNFG